MKEKMVLLNTLIVDVVVGDSLNYHIGMKFSAYDADNDNQTDASPDGNCAAYYTGGWWYN